jgi:hypothetical protein
MKERYSSRASQDLAAAQRAWQISEALLAGLTE